MVKVIYRKHTNFCTEKCEQCIEYPKYLETTNESQKYLETTNKTQPNRQIEKYATKFFK